MKTDEDRENEEKEVGGREEDCQSVVGNSSDVLRKSLPPKSCALKETL